VTREGFKDSRGQGFEGEDRRTSNIERQTSNGELEEGFEGSRIQGVEGNAEKLQGIKGLAESI
jgi:hypothetical protein